MIWLKVVCIFCFASSSYGALIPESEVDEGMEVLENMIMKIGEGERVKRATTDRGVS